MADAPVTADFLADTAEEAQYQIDHWGEAHDADKDDSFWFWTLGHIAGKAIHDPTQTVEKQRHRLRAAAAILLNWDRHIARRNGIDVGPLLLEKAARRLEDQIPRVLAEIDRLNEELRIETLPIPTGPLPYASRAERDEAAQRIATAKAAHAPKPACPACGHQQGGGWATTNSPPDELGAYVESVKARYS